LEEKDVTPERGFNYLLAAHNSLGIKGNKKMNKDIINEKLNFFYKEKCRVHVSRFDGMFWNGIITNKKSDDVFEFYEDKFGESLLFISEIRDVNLCREVGK